MKYNKIYNLIKSECEEIYFINECENFLEENELNIKDFNENDIIIFSNLTLNYNNVINILNKNKIKFYENEDLLNLKYIII
tara:strand:- start:999 stop:1241 length:243 start_codon:yes stop_codon:yes gene_type:complete